MNQPGQSQQNINQQPKTAPLKGKESFDKNEQKQKFAANQANEKSSEAYVPNKKKNEEEQIDSDSVSE